VARYEAGVVGSSAGVQRFMDGCIDPRFLLGKELTLMVGMMVSASVGLKLVTTSVNSLTSLTGSVDGAQGVLKTGLSLARPLLYIYIYI